MLRPRGDGPPADRYDRACDTSIQRPCGRRRLGREPGRARPRHADPDAHPDVRVPQHAATHADPDTADTHAYADVHLSDADPDADTD